MAEHLARCTTPEGIVFLGRAQEKTPVIRMEKRHNPTTGQAYSWLVRSTAPVNHVYFYGVDHCGPRSWRTRLQGDPRAP